jgi:thiol-disulfide isomerase/thioredoxin
VGDPAPPLANLKWLRGEPVTSFEPGMVHVVEFWAPWCPDCRAALSTYANLSQKYAAKNVRTLAIAVWPKRNAPDMVRDFVEDAGDLFPYPVAEDIDNANAKAWLEAAQVAIPTAVVVGGDGRIAWMGDPRDGLQGAISEALEEAARVAMVTSGRRAYSAEISKANLAEKHGQWAAAAQQTRQLYEQAPTQLWEMSPAHYVALVRLGDDKAASAWGERMLTKDFAEQPLALNLLAWRMVEPEGVLPPEKVDLALALRIAQRADDLTYHSNAYILDTLARVQYLNKDLPGALRTQLRAVAAAAKIDPKKDSLAPALRKELADRLAQYTEEAEQADAEVATPGRP